MVRPSAKDKAYIKKAIRMLSFVACLDYAMLDLEDELRDAGVLKHTVKHRFNMALATVQRVHSSAYKMLNDVNPRAGYEYNDKTDLFYNSVSKCVLLSPPERSYNIVLAILRIIEKLCEEISPEYYFHQVQDLKNLPSILSCCKIKDHHIDDIISINIQ